MDADDAELSGLPEPPTRLAGELHDESSHCWDVEMSRLEELGSLGVVEVVERDPEDGSYFRRWQCVDRRLARVAALAYDLAEARHFQEQCDAAIPAALTKAGSADLGRKEIGDRTDKKTTKILAAYAKWAVEDGVARDHFAAEYSKRFKGKRGYSKRTIHRAIESLERRLRSSAENLRKAGLNSSMINARLLELHKSEPGVCKATISMALAPPQRKAGR